MRKRSKRMVAVLLLYCVLVNMIPVRYIKAVENNGNMGAGSQDIISLDTPTPFNNNFEISKNVINSDKKEMEGILAKKIGFNKPDEGSRAADVNDDPNRAYVLPFNEGVNDSISANDAKKWRWFGSVIEEKTRMTLFLVTPEAPADFDLYVYRLNQTTSSLELVSSSQNNPGMNELVDILANPGVYYFCVNAYIGEGAYYLINYSSANYINYEINDSESAAVLQSIEIKRRSWMQLIPRLTWIIINLP